MRSFAPIAPEVLAGRLDRLGFSFPSPIVERLAVYLGLLMKWNAAMNLVGTASWEKTLETLVADSFHLARFLPLTGYPPAPRTFDLGAGAGLPGIPLRMVWHEGSYTLVEARQKRALFMKTALASLDLERTRVFQGRAEAFFMKEEPADLIISRAFMPWREMLAFIADALAPGGRVLFLASTPLPEEPPAPWRLVAQQAYPAGDPERHFWCLARGAS